MSDTFAIWTPKFDGDAPPNWKAGMKWDSCTSHPTLTTRHTPSWFTGTDYYVPPEAIDTDATPFDVEAWLSQGRANRDKLPEGVAEALGPERDWADEAASAWHHDDENLARELASILRSRCRPINDTVTDDAIEDAYTDWISDRHYWDDSNTAFKSACRKHFAGLTFPEAGQ